MGKDNKEDNKKAAEEETEVDFEHYVRTTKDHSFDQATIILVAVIVLLLYPLTKCAQQRKRRRRMRRKNDLEKEKEIDASDPPGGYVAPIVLPENVLEKDDTNKNTASNRPKPERPDPIGNNIWCGAIPGLEEDDMARAIFQKMDPIEQARYEIDTLYERMVEPDENDTDNISVTHYDEEGRENKQLLNRSDVYKGMVAGRRKGFPTKEAKRQDSAEPEEGEDDEEIDLLYHEWERVDPLYYESDFSHLPTLLREAALRLGYTQQTWGSTALEYQPPVVKKRWVDLTSREKQDVETLGFTAMSWEGMARRQSDPPDLESSQNQDSLFVTQQQKQRTSFFTLFCCCDKESRRILKLAVPGTIGSASCTLVSAVTSALVSKHLGPSKYIAYSMVFVFLGIANSLHSGIPAACNILAAQTIGSGNYFLAGQYRQAGLILSQVISILLYTILWFYMEDLIVVVGLDKQESKLAMEYLPWSMASYTVSSFSSCLSDLMWADDKGGTMTIIDNTYYILYLGMVFGIIFYLPNGMETTLTHLGMVDLGGSVLYWIMIHGYVSCIRNWLQPFHRGLFQSLSIRNMELVKSIFKISIPLTLGTVVSTCEWEILTLFAAHMGSAEVATWTILGSIWGMFEYFPTGIATAAEVRISRHLGQGIMDVGDDHVDGGGTDKAKVDNKMAKQHHQYPGLAKLAAYKCLLFSFIMTSVVTLAFSYYKNEIIGYYTDVPVIQEMVSDLIFLIGIANVVMVIGVLAYTILCAQNRSRLATSVYVFLSFCITLPLSTWFVFGKGYDLQSVTFSLIAGYSASSLVLLVLVFTTNWTRCSESVCKTSQRAQERYDERILATTTTTVAAARSPKGTEETE